MKRRNFLNSSVYHATKISARLVWKNIWGQTLRMVKWSRFHVCSMAVRMSSWKLISRHLALRQFLRSMHGFDCKLTLTLILIFVGVPVMAVLSMSENEALSAQKQFANVDKKFA
jgi:hypothetical protein